LRVMNERRGRVGTHQKEEPGGSKGVLKNLPLGRKKVKWSELSLTGVERRAKKQKPTVRRSRVYLEHSRRLSGKRKLDAKKMQKSTKGTSVRQNETSQGRRKSLRRNRGEKPQKGQTRMTSVTAEGESMKKPLS